MLPPEFKRHPLHAKLYYPYAGFLQILVNQLYDLDFSDPIETSLILRFAKRGGVELGDIMVKLHVSYDLAHSWLEGTEPPPPAYHEPLRNYLAAYLAAQLPHPPEGF